MPNELWFTGGRGSGRGLLDAGRDRFPSMAGGLAFGAEFHWAFNLWLQGGGRWRGTLQTVGANMILNLLNLCCCSFHGLDKSCYAENEVVTTCNCHPLLILRTGAVLYRVTHVYCCRRRGFAVINLPLLPKLKGNWTHFFQFPEINWIILID